MILICLLIAGLVGLLFIDSIPQDSDYHHFADTRWFLGIPNFNDVVSNTGFAIAGITGLVIIFLGKNKNLFDQKQDAWPYRVFFIGVALISLGSAYYHLAPSNDRLFWDRLPMSIAFMAFISAVIADRVNRKSGNTWLLALLVALGMLSLLYWIITESQGHGDLRFYAFVQFYPILMLPFVLWLFPVYRYTASRFLGWVIAWYALSKVLEYNDKEVFNLLGKTVSGHTLKHLAAAVGALVILRMLSVRKSSNTTIDNQNGDD